MYWGPGNVPLMVALKEGECTEWRKVVEQAVRKKPNSSPNSRCGGNAAELSPSPGESKRGIHNQSPECMW
ncbi:hypothetical protein H671_5g14081 [Cricetulus griseus]|nr:hypothetical protein H671_5g14081 [Cricetulus griseus]